MKSFPDSNVDETSSRSRKTLYNVFKEEIPITRGAESNRSVLIFTHRQADPDALCAAYALSLLLSQSFPDYHIESTIVVPQGASALGTSVSASLNIPFQTSIDEASISDADLIVAVDTGDEHLLEPYLEKIAQSGARKILVDHHSTSEADNKWTGFNKRIVESKATSTCELVALGFAPVVLTKNVASVLLTGLLYDSQHLGIANETTLEAALVLVRAGAEIHEAKKNLRSRPDRSELLARIKSAQRLQYVEYGGRLILKTEVSSFHAAVARMLIEIGADIGIAYGENGGEARLSARSTQSFYAETHIDLATTIVSLSESLGLVGGGHATAASLSGPGDAADIANQLIERLKEALPKK